VYLLRCRDGSLYAGATNDLIRRLARHAAGKGAAYTRARLPIALAYVEPAGDRSTALRREAALKRLGRNHKLALAAAWTPPPPACSDEGMSRRYVAFLGGINVGGHRVAMDRLKAEFEAAGLAGVWTFIASGNVAFEGAEDPPALETRLEAHLAQQLGYPVPTFVRPAEAVVDVVGREPFGALGAGDTHLIGFLRAKPSAAARRTAEALSNGTDTLIVQGAELHWRIRGKVLDSSLGAAVVGKALGQPLTTRNMNSLRKLAAKLA
jgi:uncharacterized protein (DUF1697 family)/predicted GIY-YIG superfamily endonuclease